MITDIGRNVRRGVCFTDQPGTGARHQHPSPSLYEQLEALPAGLTGEILNGQLYTQPRPSLEHGFTETSLAAELVGPFQKGRGGGPGRWLIVVEPELHFIRDTEVDVPDLAGWRRERLRLVPKAQHRALVVPDWVCVGAKRGGKGVNGQRGQYPLR